MLAALHASALLDPVTDEMRRLARRRSHQGRSLVVTSFLVGASNKHTLAPTSFANLGRKTEWDSETSQSVLETKDKALFRVVDILRKRSPALCTPNTTLLVTHDIAGIPSLKDGVRYHYVAPDAASNSMNRRWMILVHILREYTFDCVCAPVPPMRTCCRACASSHMATRPCADAIDATDVAVLWMPSCLALPERLVIGSDGRYRRLSSRGS